MECTSHAPLRLLENAIRSVRRSVVYRKQEEVTAMTDIGDHHSRREASAKARERVVQALCLHFERDHIDLADFERRMDAAYAARSDAELAHLLSTLPALPDAQGAATPAKAEPRLPAAYDRDLIVTVLGEVRRRGPWAPPPHLTVVTLAGGVLLDLRKANFPEDGTEIRVVSVLGGATEILVSPGLRVEIAGTPVAGSFTRESTDAAPDPEAPLLRVKGVALLGGVTVKTLLPGEAYEPEW